MAFPYSGKKSIIQNTYLWFYFYLSCLTFPVFHQGTLYIFASDRLNPFPDKFTEKNIP